MKMRTITLLLASLTTALHAEAPRPAFRDAATAESLSEQYRKVSLADPMKSLPPSEGEDPSVVNKVGNLLENSEVLTYNGKTTLVPKNALVHIPQKLAERVNNHQEGAKIVGWLEFHSQNRGWISTVEITFAQAKGVDPISPEVLENLGKSGNLVVAVLKGGPISVRQKKPEAAKQPEITTSQSPQP